MKKNQKNNGFNKLSDENETVLDITKMTIAEIAKYLESHPFNPELLGEEKLFKCIAYFKNRCYTDAMIGEIINKSERQVRRYTKKLREQTSLQLTDDFQKDLLGELLDNWRIQFSYFIRLANKEDVSSLDRMRALYYSHQIQKDIIETLGKYGYLSKEQGQADIKREASDKEERLEDVYLLPEIPMDGIPSQELSDLQNKAVDFIMQETRKLRDKYKVE